jgi:hypothetical protein
VAFIAFDDDPFSVAAGANTGVSLEFTVGLETVVISLAGESTFTANVAVSDACDSACTDPQVCAVVDNLAPACVTLCDPADDDEADACLGPDDVCLASTADAGAALGVCREIN